MKQEYILVNSTIHYVIIQFKLFVDFFKVSLNGSIPSLATQQECILGAVDLAFVIDGSQSVGVTNFQVCRKIIMLLAKKNKTYENIC